MYIETSQKAQQQMSVYVPPQQLYLQPPVQVPLHVQQQQRQVCLPLFFTPFLAKNLTVFSFVCLLVISMFVFAHLYMKKSLKSPVCHQHRTQKAQKQQKLGAGRFFVCKV